MKLLRESWFLNSFTIGSRALGDVLGRHFCEDVNDLVFTPAETAALAALEWGVLCCAGKLRVLKLARDDRIGVDAMQHLSELLRSALPSLEVLELLNDRSAGFS